MLRKNFPTRRSTRLIDHCLLSRKHISSKPFYVTTPIFYVNADPHIGHLHSMVLADVFARYAKLQSGVSSVLATGTDEHGLKIQRVAESRNEEPIALCDRVSERFKELARAANIDYTRFIRTTDDDHIQAVNHLWKTLQDNGYIYKGSHSGWYAVSDEAYYTESQVHDVLDEATGKTHKAAIESGQRVEWTEEENYLFKLSMFRERLVDWYQSDKQTVVPEMTRSDLIKQLCEHELADLSISRPSSRLTWGIQVPGDPEQTIYVWLDALTNYLTVTGYPWKKVRRADSAWPANVQIVGKDIVRFHAIYWPALLMACGLALPKTILAHAHWTMGSFKMSKSRGNVANPFEAMRLVGTDAVRYYLMRAGGALPSDADYSEDRLYETYRKDLAGQLGNLSSRIVSPKVLGRLQNVETAFKEPEHQVDSHVLDALRELPNNVARHMQSFKPNLALISIFECITLANRMLQSVEPWREQCSAKDAQSAIFAALETLRFAAILLEPFMPATAQNLQRRLNCRNTPLEIGAGYEKARLIDDKSLLFPKPVAK